MGTQKEVIIKCQGTIYKQLDELENFQDNLKELAEDDYLKLRHSIESRGFLFPIFIWSGHNKMIDGHQRVFTLKRMREDGFEIPAIPCVEIEADSERKAKEALLASSSRYGVIIDQGLYEFMSKAELSFDDIQKSFKLPEIDEEMFKKMFFDDIADIEDASDFNEGVNFIIKCENKAELDELKEKLGVNKSKIPYSDFKRNMIHENRYH